MDNKYNMRVGEKWAVAEELARDSHVVYEITRVEGDKVWGICNVARGEHRLSFKLWHWRRYAEDMGMVFGAEEWRAMCAECGGRTVNDYLCRGCRG